MGLPMLQDSYPADEYITSLAKSQTPCFGLSFEVKDTTCRTCPLAKSCQGQFYENLEQASELITRQNEPLEPSEDVDKAIPEPVNDMSKVTVFAAFADSICCVCGRNIPQGTVANHHMRDGFFHKDCSDDFQQGVRHKG